MPQYMLLIYGDPADAPGPEEQEAQYAEWLNYTNSLVASGALVSGAPLEGGESAKTVRVRDGETILSDGPFADTKEVLGGFYVVNAATPEDAIALTERMPNIDHNTVEVRPVVEFQASG